MSATFEKVPTPLVRDFRGCGHVAPQSLRTRLATLVAKYGVAPLARRLGVEQRTVLRFVAGGGVRHSTIFLVEAYLPKLEGEAEAQQPAAAPESSPTPTPRDNGGVR